jgi:hypothetical protein
MPKKPKDTFTFSPVDLVHALPTFLGVLAFIPAVLAYLQPYKVAPGVDLLPLGMLATVVAAFISIIVAWNSKETSGLTRVVVVNASWIVVMIGFFFWLFYSLGKFFSNMF